MDCPPGFTLKRKRNKKNSRTSTSKAEEGKEESHGLGTGHLNEGVHIKMINGHAEDCPPGFTLKRKRNKKNSTSTRKAEEGKEGSHGVGRGHLNEGVHIKMINGHAEDCPPGFTLKRKRNKKNNSTSTRKAEEGKEESHDVGRGLLNEGVHIKMINGHAEVRGVYPIAPPNIVAPIIKNVTRKDLAVPAIHSQLFRSGPRNMPRPEVKKEVPEFNPDQPDSAPQSRIPASLGKKYPSPAVLAAVKPQTVLGI